MLPRSLGNQSPEGSLEPVTGVWGEFPSRAVWSLLIPTSFASFQHLDYRLRFSDAEQGMALGFLLCFEILESPSR